jgi:hypothetical protein
VRARFMTAGHEASTPKTCPLPKIAGGEQKIIFRNSIPGKRRNLNCETPKHEGVPQGWNRAWAAKRALSSPPRGELQLSDRIGENAW